MEAQALLRDIREELRRLGREVQQPDVYTLPDAAARLSISLTKLKRLVRFNRILTVRVGERSMVARHEIERVSREGTFPASVRMRAVPTPSKRAQRATAKTDAEKLREYVAKPRKSS